MAITMSEIVEAIHEGIRTANRKYSKWSNGRWLHDSGVEGVMVTYIAATVNERQEERESLDIELAFEYIEDWADARPSPGRRPNTVRGSNRADIVLLNKDDKPTCVIEVKREWNGAPCIRDLVRIRDLILRCSFVKEGSLRRGFLAMMIAKKETATKSAWEKVEEQVAKIKRNIEKDFDSNKVGVRFHHKKIYSADVGENWNASSFCVEIYIKN